MKNRDFVLLYINGERVEVRGADVFLMLSEFLRYRRRLTGTKVVCAEGDCGACTVMSARPRPGRAELTFQAVNSCILPVFLADGAHLVTIEGLREDGALNEVQDRMCQFNGAQCGFCTPGIVMALTEMFENHDRVEAKTVKNYLTGNLCRCTGYQPIIDAALAAAPAKIQRLSERYGRRDAQRELQSHVKVPVLVHDGDRVYSSPLTATGAARFRAKHKAAQVVSAATDLGVQANKGMIRFGAVLSLNRISTLYRLEKSGGRIHAGAKITLDELERFAARHIPELESFLRVFASKQIKNTATLAGNVVNGSPIGDTLPFLRVTGAVVELTGATGKRSVEFARFYKGYRRPDVRPGEIVTGIHFEIPGKQERLRLFKVSQRKDLDISCVNAAFRLSVKNGRVADARLALGGVDPVVLALPKSEAFLRGRALDADTVEGCVRTMAGEIAPRSDVRGTAAYRVALSQSLFRKFVAEMS